MSGALAGTLGGGISGNDVRNSLDVAGEAHSEQSRSPLRMWAR
jgi:hypothetical protein